MKLYKGPEWIYLTPFERYVRREDNRKINLQIILNGMKTPGFKKDKQEDNYYYD